MEKLILTAAITGAEQEKAKVPVLPCTPEEQARASKECVEAGVAVLHLHVRDDAGKPSQELAHFRRTVDAINQACPQKPVIQFSTGGAIGEPMERRLASLACRPDMGSFNTGTMNFGEDIFVNTFPEMRALAKAFQQNDVIPEFEIYDAGHLDNLKKLIKEGVVKPSYHCQFVLGVPGAMTGEISNLVFLVNNLPPDSTWGVAGVGRYQLPLAAHAVAMGGHVRIGLEDNIYYSKGVLAMSNAELAARVVRIAKELGRPVATPAEARQILGLRA